MGPRSMGRMPPEISFDDFPRGSWRTLQAAVGSAGLNRPPRVEALEEANQAQFATAVALKEIQQLTF